MYGESIKDQLHTMCSYFNIKAAVISLEDAGALPFVIAARFEAALKRIGPIVR
jgi:citrate lyase subunit beta / citryl-CoA lyase